MRKEERKVNENSKVYNMGFKVNGSVTNRDGKRGADLVRKKETTLCIVCSACQIAIQAVIHQLFKFLL